jgi:hypothetical protein
MAIRKLAWAMFVFFVGFASQAAAQIATTVPPEVPGAKPVSVERHIAKAAAWSATLWAVTERRVSE